jgi:hypothetical protein
VARNLLRIIIRLGDYGRKAIASPTPGIVRSDPAGESLQGKKLTRDRVVPTVDARAEQYRTATGEREWRTVANLGTTVFDSTRPCG